MTPLRLPLAFLAIPQFDPESDDPRVLLKLRKPDFRFNFALNCMTFSCSECVPIYTVSRLDAQLDEATRQVVEPVLRFDRERRTVYLPKICDWYAGDFGFEDDVLPTATQNELDNASLGVLLSYGRLEDATMLEYAYGHPHALVSAYEYVAYDFRFRESLALDQTQPSARVYRYAYTSTESKRSSSAMSAAMDYRSDGGSSTESEDGAYYNPSVSSNAAIKSELCSCSSRVAASASSEAEALSLPVGEEEIKPAIIDLQPETEAEAPTVPCCSACGYAMLVVPQAELLKAEAQLACRCCLLVLPDSCFSNTQKSEARSAVRKCKACTGNVHRGEPPRVTPTRAKPELPIEQRRTRTQERDQEYIDVFTNRVARLKMARRALLRKREAASKLRSSKTKEDYEQQIATEEQALDRQAALLKRENPTLFDQLNSSVKIKKPSRNADRDQKKKTKKQKARTKEWVASKKKRKAEEAAARPRPKRRAPAVDPSTYTPPVSRAQEQVPARGIPTRARASTRSQTTGAEVKMEVKAELPKVEPKME
ncbi:hypothetical protein BBJ28_00011208 [Nothophytophthora sp. Chile5]|nr:hypothetical protein BBJ28_00011208 [Nothophytophthora sp. Chile5]